MPGNAGAVGQSKETARSASRNVARVTPRLESERLRKINSSRRCNSSRATGPPFAQPGAEVRMANRTATSSATSDFERQVVAFAEQLGSILGAAQARTEGWLAHAPLREHLAQIRDRASELLAYI